MLDLDLLKKGDGRFKNYIYYKCSLGAYRFEIKSIIKNLFLEKGFEVREFDFQKTGSIREGSLFGEVLVIVDGLEKASEDVILELVKQLKRGVENKVFILGCEKWESQLKELEDFCTLIEEGGVGKSSFNKVFEYELGKLGSKFQIKEFGNLDLFKNLILDVFKQNRWGLIELRKHLEYLFFMCFDFEENKLDLDVFRQLNLTQGRVEFFEMHKTIFKVCKNKLKKHLLIELVDRQLNRELMSKRLIIANLFRGVNELLYINVMLNKSGEVEGFSEFKKNILKDFGGCKLSELLKLNLLLSKYEPQFNTRNFLLSLDSMLKEF